MEYQVADERGGQVQRAGMNQTIKFGLVPGSRPRGRGVDEAGFGPLRRADQLRSEM